MEASSLHANHVDVVGVLFGAAAVVLVFLAWNIPALRRSFWRVSAIVLAGNLAAALLALPVLKSVPSEHNARVVSQTYGWTVDAADAGCLGELTNTYSPTTTCTVPGRDTSGTHTLTFQVVSGRIVLQVDGALVVVT